MRREKGVVEIDLRVRQPRANIGVRRQMPSHVKGLKASFVREELAANDGVREVGLKKSKVRMALRGLQVRAPTQFQIVETHDHRAAFEETINQVAPNKARRPCDQAFCHVRAVKMPEGRGLRKQKFLGWAPMSPEGRVPRVPLVLGQLRS